MVQLDFLILLCGFPMMNDQCKENLARLLIELRGDLSYRQFALKINMNYASLRAWEKMESFPTLESLGTIAALKNWTLIKLLQYLGFEISSNQIKEFILTNFDKGERIKLARELLDFE